LPKRAKTVYPTIALRRLETKREAKQYLRDLNEKSKDLRK